MYPNLIVDNFFEDPNSIVEIANSVAYNPTKEGWWPGSRSNYLHNIHPRLFDSITRKITSLFFDTCKEWSYEVCFQKVIPFSKNQYYKKNCGWVHLDYEYNFGGVIFLNKNPDNDTGVSLFKSKKGFHSMTHKEEEVKKRHFSVNDVEDSCFEESYDSYHNQFEETVKIKNIFNRLVIFDSKTLHAVQTYGTKERLTIPFFNTNISSKLPPLYR